MDTLIELLQVYFLGGSYWSIGWILEHYVAIIRKTELDCSAISTGKDMHMATTLAITSGTFYEVNCAGGMGWYTT